MPEEVLFVHETRSTRADVADYLRTVADSLDAGNDLTLSDGGESVTVSPPDSVEFEVKVEREGSEKSVEFELEWGEGDGGGGGDLTIE